MSVNCGARVRLKHGWPGFACAPHRRDGRIRPAPCASHTRDGGVFNVSDVGSPDHSRGKAALPAKIAGGLSGARLHTRAVRVAAVQQTGEPKMEFDEHLQPPHGTESAKVEQEAMWRPSPLQGALLMFGCALLWGTSPVCTRYLYLSPEPPSSSILAAVQTTTSALALSSMLLLQDQPAAKQLFWKWKEGRSSTKALQSSQLAADDQKPTNGLSLECQPARTFSWSDIAQYPFPVPTQVTGIGSFLWCNNVAFHCEEQLCAHFCCGRRLPIPGMDLGWLLAMGLPARSKCTIPTLHFWYIGKSLAHHLGMCVFLSAWATTHKRAWCTFVVQGIWEKVRCRKGKTRLATLFDCFVRTHHLKGVIGVPGYSGE